MPYYPLSPALPWGPRATAGLQVCEYEQGVRGEKADDVGWGKGDQRFKNKQ